MTTKTDAGELAKTLDRIMQELDAGATNLPEDAIRDARIHRDNIIPRLIQSLENATAMAASGDIPEGKAHFFAMFLLTEFQAKESLPALLGAISLPGELPFDLFGDAITETLPAVLADLANDRPDLLSDLISKESSNAFVRAAAANAYLYLVRDGYMSRENAVACLLHHFREALSNQDKELVTNLVCSLISFSPDKSATEIRQAFHLNLVHCDVVDLEYFEQCISEGESRFQKELEFCRPTGIQDTVAELNNWYAFADDPELRLPSENDEQPLSIDPTFEPDRGLETTIRNTLPRVGRNESCPCNSGKKYKKCCGARSF